ncbi:MAG: M81 family metallopeptidase [Acidobacteria bacterium]|nr:M81 family metallopeptidase [Acidobacteriota bacterium]
MKLFLASLGTETNTFSPFPTGYRTFEETCLVRGGRHGPDPFLFAVPLILWRRLALRNGWSVAESLCAFAQPSGVTLGPVYESFREEILADLRRAMPVDMVLLSLHGAMVAEGYDDCEGDLLARIRAMVGPKVPVGVELDLHCHLTRRMVEEATAIVSFKEYPHTDAADRAKELFHILSATASGAVRPHMALHDCGMMGIYHTTSEPMKSYLAGIKHLEQRKDILSISIAHGFLWGDVADMGTRVLVVTDGVPGEGNRLAESLGRQLFQLRQRLRPDYRTIDQALGQALSQDRGPVVLADVADNPGGGASGDSTFILEALIDQRIEDAAVACIWDPTAVAVATEAGEGARLDVRLGGKMGPSSGRPLDIPVTVAKVVPNACQTFGSGAGRSVSPLGDAVVLRTGGIDIVVNSIRTQTLGADAFTNMGIDPGTRRILVVKSMQHFHAAFSPLARQILYVDTPGALVSDATRIPFRNADRSQWPICETVA